jgi:hypothetical protein
MAVRWVNLPRDVQEKKREVLTENKTTQNKPKQHRARDETQKKEKISARTSKAENTQKGKPKGKREKQKTLTNSRNEAANHKRQP